MRAFVAGEHYTIADIAIFAYAGLAAEAGLCVEPYGHFRAWMARVRTQPGFLDTMYPYSIDPHSTQELG